MTMTTHSLSYLSLMIMLFIGYYSMWDNFGNLLEPLASKIPIMTTGGNHEVGSAESWLSYSVR